jgi:archaetidylinositol phosphate synthase
VTFYARRDRFASCSAALGTWLTRLPVSANGWTGLGLAAGLLAALAVAGGRLAAGGLLLLFSGFCDLADGAVARERGSASREGAYLDTLADRFSEAAVVFGLLVAPLPPLFGLAASYWLFLYMFLSMMVTYAKAAAREKGLALEELRGGGVLERPERVVILAAGLIIGGTRPMLFVYALATVTLLAALSLAQRVRLAVAESRRRGLEGP